MAQRRRQCPASAMAALALCSAATAVLAAGAEGGGGGATRMLPTGAAVGEAELVIRIRELERGMGMLREELAHRRQAGMPGAAQRGAAAAAGGSPTQLTQAAADKAAERNEREDEKKELLRIIGVSVVAELANKTGRNNINKKVKHALKWLHTGGPRAEFEAKKKAIEDVALSVLEEDAEAAAKPRFFDHVQCLFDFGKTHAKSLLKPALTSQCMLVVSILLVLQWHIRFHFGDMIHERCFANWFTKRQVKPMLTPRKIGINMIIFGIYYDKDLLNNLLFPALSPFINSCLVVFLDSVVMFKGFQFIAPKREGIPDTTSEWINPCGADDDGICPEKSAATNIYEDLTVKFRRVAPVWVVQIILLALYVEELNRNSHTIDIDNVDFVYWMVAVIFQMHGGDDAVGEAYNWKYWCKVCPIATATDVMNGPSGEQPLLSSCAVGEDERKEPEDVNQVFRKLGHRRHKIFWWFPVTLRSEWLFRRFMDWTVNSVSRNIILYTVPIMVCIEAPLEFVKDLTAVMFITMLDNIEGDPKDLEEIAVKTRFEFWYDRHEDRWARESGGINEVELTGLESDYVKSQMNADKFKDMKAYIEHEKDQGRFKGHELGKLWDALMGRPAEKPDTGTPGSP